MGCRLAGLGEGDVDVDVDVDVLAARAGLGLAVRPLRAIGEVDEAEVEVVGLHFGVLEILAVELDAPAAPAEPVRAAAAGEGDREGDLFRSISPYRASSCRCRRYNGESFGGRYGDRSVVVTVGAVPVWDIRACCPAALSTDGRARRDPSLDSPLAPGVPLLLLLPSAVADREYARPCLLRSVTDPTVPVVARLSGPW